MQFKASITCHSRTGVPDGPMRELVAAGLAELDARIVGVSPIPGTGRVTVGLVLDAPSEQHARESIHSAITADNRFGELVWSIAALYAIGTPDSATFDGVHRSDVR